MPQADPSRDLSSQGKKMIYRATIQLTGPIVWRPGNHPTTRRLCRAGPVRPITVKPSGYANTRRALEAAELAGKQSSRSHPPEIRSR